MPPVSRCDWVDANSGVAREYTTRQPAETSGVEVTLLL